MDRDECRCSMVIVGKGSIGGVTCLMFYSCWSILLACKAYCLMVLWALTFKFTEWAAFVCSCSFCSTLYETNNFSVALDLVDISYNLRLSALRLVGSKSRVFSLVGARWQKGSDGFVSYSSIESDFLYQTVVACLVLLVSQMC